MVVNIDKIIVKDRIRKDFGDISELAEDIKQNGLINPPVVNKEYELLAGERRLRACKSLGWTQIEIRMMDTRDAEHELNVEISENDVRKGFTKSERVDYMKRLLRIEAAKASEREHSGVKNPSPNSDEGRSDEKTAKQFGIGKDTLRKEISIVENKDLLDPSDFTEWDEGKLSTNKTFQKIKERQKEVEAENDKLRKALSESEAKRISEKSQTREVIKEVEVVPDDYESIKKRIKSLESENRLLADDRQRALDRANESDERIKDLEHTLNSPEEAKRRNLEARCFDLTSAITAFLGKHGGEKFSQEELTGLSKYEKQSLERAIDRLRNWIDEFMSEVEVTYELRNQEN